jgi:hypothetical protein
MTSSRQQGAAHPHYILISSDSVFMACDRSFVTEALQRHGKLRESDAVRLLFAHFWLLFSNAVLLPTYVYVHVCVRARVHTSVLLQLFVCRIKCPHPLFEIFL